MAHQDGLVCFTHALDVLGGIIHGLGNLLVCSSLAKPQPQQGPVTWIPDILFNRSGHIAVFVIRHNTPPKKKNAATFPKDEWRLILAALFYYRH